MLSTFQNIFKIPELRKRILFTIVMVIVYRLGSFIPTPGVDARALSLFFSTQTKGLLGLVDMFSGGALSKFSVFALGIMPYISTSIIISLLTVVIPQLEQLQREGEAGRKKINQYTRYGTIFLCVMQGFFTSFWLQKQNVGGLPVVFNPGIGFQLTAIITLTAGTVFLMWIGEQITEYGIGNGISFIIFAGIVDRIPRAIVGTFRLLRVGQLNIFTLGFVLAVAAVTIIGAIFIEQGVRKIPVQYARHIVGRKVYGGQSTYLPLKVDMSGVIAVIFAISVLMIPAFITQVLPFKFLQSFVKWFQNGGILYTLLYAGLIIFFCYFYTAIVFNPTDVAENMKKYGGFIPGVRPGKPTAEHIDRIIMRITLIGALAVAAIAVVPDIFQRRFNVPFDFGGTALLIVIGVALDTMKQVESHLLMRHYEGFMKKGRLVGRSTRF
ncbi:preprotein translocase subunit SecY [Candidatus Desantisbacteria bacterium CG_4_10_14_0_8_um_filter_48_22]|uniref:Protein translocase subunit SecY n=1 Tax=Candidatus Desantisbacteria bacterium CG_4_10_14_0_8_um_filter_48_22 TaxID=1974543 RepID=A0A2M7SA37_9BACT|nr:MAG: preprotein translocase subunit SecY [Candidatus Desantisbacteria bacterium CG1_02_49_89]PIV54663.1 MAG: preprotein translocase subunit SecY [Candidatus Desantisbacteria bacterium CG02_land_8_20_14_3_00_49_13]PIZ16163.1 MAG: preprotein translocase subunit SecY [Candidatus Desantisbacteria bacterium CG_4_10_14_0_8_um_filter_48_22]PJB27602.1 MAG: preprotein translocase subunit SecY [Candidatus Desantisbacteria bacterium CG_4_9_14_3_um_filter_50_7]